MNVQRDSRGFTLVEVMIALAISGIVLASVYTAFQSQQQSYVAQDQVAEMQQSARAGLNMMLQELRMAGYDPDKVGGTGITTANVNLITFTMVADDDGDDNDNDGATDEAGELKTISYDLYDAYGDGDTDIGRQVGAAASSKRALVENVDNIEFNYLDASGNVTANVNNIRMIQLSILVRAERDTRNITNTMVYCPASNPYNPATQQCTDPVAAAAAVPPWGTPFNDNFRRRLVITTIKCRNLGI